MIAPADIYFPAGRNLENPHAPPDSSTLSPKAARDFDVDADSGAASSRTLLPREDGTDIGISSPVPLSDEAVSIITKLREMKDKDDDYSRWKDVVFRARSAEKLDPGGIGIKRGQDLDGRASKRAREMEMEERKRATSNSSAVDRNQLPGDIDRTIAPGEGPVIPIELSWMSADTTEDSKFCSECYLPLHPDPEPDKLFIFLHALRYTTREWSFGTEMPFWAARDYRWKGDSSFNPQ
jgi:hypothetical protein